jgi:hypothetical protein
LRIAGSRFSRSAIRNLKPSILLALVVVAASAVVFWASIPPRRERVGVPSEWQDLASRTVAGAYHVHSLRSDGTGDKAAVAAAAARAGLKFVILTDHGDGTRPPDPPAYVDGVLCIDAVEISTSDGHYVALDMPRAPYPLGGFAEAVVEDVSRLGGFGIAAHPDSPKPSLRWTPERLPVDGIEWLNGDSEWRDESRLTLTRAALGYVVRPSEALGRLLDRPATLDRWDRWSSTRPIVALAGADAHGGIGRRAEDATGGDALLRLGIPSYEASFGTFSNRAIVDHPLTGNAAQDARMVLDAVRAGRVFTVIDAIASPGLLDLHRDGTTVVARVLGPPAAQLVLLHSGREVARVNGSELRWESGGERGPFRVEVHVPRAPGAPPVPWMVSNEIFTALTEPKTQAGFEVPWTGALAAPLAWRIEKEASSSVAMRSSAAGVVLEYRLGTDRARSPYVALATDVHTSRMAAIEAALTADRPLRVSIQVRVRDGSRWGQSLYVDSSDRLFRVPLEALRSPVGSGGKPSAGSVVSILLVIDLTNAFPGSAGRLTLRSLSLLD